jgi:hypothetical protein
MQAVRNLDDLECMAVPDKFKQIMTFYKYYSGEKQAPYPTLFSESALWTGGPAAPAGKLHMAVQSAVAATKCSSCLYSACQGCTPGLGHRCHSTSKSSLVTSQLQRRMDEHLFVPCSALPSPYQ